MPMSERTTPEVLTEGVREHPAVQAWLQIQSDSWEPSSLELLQGRRYSTVYRLNHVRQDGARVIAKRCRTATARIAAGARYSPQLPHNRALAGRWLAKTQLAAMSAGLRSCFPDRGLGHYLRLLQACRAMLLHHLDGSAMSTEDATVFRNIAAHLDALESLWGELEEICDVMPRTLVHGDFVNKNLRVRDTATGDVLLVFDWEFTGWGVPAADLAQLIDRVASPDLNLYCSILNREYSHVHLRDVQAVAACGNLLRLVDQMSWTTVGQELVCPTQLVKALVLLHSVACYGICSVAGKRRAA